MPEVWTLESWDEPESEVVWESDGLDYDDAFPESLGNGYHSPAAYQAEALVLRTMERLSPTEAEDFWKTVQNIGRQVAPIAAQVLPVAAPLIGTAIGGPLGGMIGGAAGRFAGQMLGGAGGAPPRPAAAAVPAAMGGIAGMLPGVAGAIPGTPSALPSGSTSATAQLLSFIQNPALLQSLLGQLMGGTAGGTVPVGTQGTPASFTSFMNALGVLANQAASEAEGGYVSENESVPAYLLSPSGHLDDPTIPENRARALLERLQEGRAAETYRVNGGAAWS